MTKYFIKTPKAFGHIFLTENDCQSRSGQNSNFQDSNLILTSKKREIFNQKWREMSKAISHLNRVKKCLAAKGNLVWGCWSSGYGRGLMFWRSWVQIPAPYTGWTFYSHIFVVKIVMFVWKGENKWKRDQGLPF